MATFAIFTLNGMLILLWCSLANFLLNKFCCNNLFLSDWRKNDAADEAQKLSV